MAYGNIKADKLLWDNNGTDAEVDISTLGATRTDTEITNLANTAADARIAADLAAGTPTIQAFDADTAKTDVAQTYTAGQRGGLTTINGADVSNNFTLNLDTSNNFRINPSATFTVTFSGLDADAVGQTGSIFIVYAGTESGSFDSNMRFVGGAAGIALTSQASAIDRIDYIVLNSTTVTCNFTANYVA